MMVLTLVLSLGVISGCTEKKEPAEKAQEAATQIAESAGEKPAEVKEAAPALPAETKEMAVEKAVEKKAEATAAVEKAVEKPAEAGKGVEAGAAIFKTKCTPCHGAAGKGTAMAPAFSGNAWVKGASNAEIADVIKNGREGAAKKYKNFVIAMPANKGMAESDINALVEYIKSIN
jgi:cbb3-type cytochrome c oxidase subunit III